MSEAATPDTGALTVDAAIASLLPAEPVEQDNAPESAAEAAPEPTEPQGDDQTPEDAAAEPEEPAEGEQTEAEAEAVVPAEPPKYWSKDAKAEFAKLPPELQAVVLAQEGPREEAAAKAKAEAAEIRQRADKEISGVKALAEQLTNFLPEALEAFRNQWGDQEPDWEAAIEQYGAEETAKLQARFNKQRNLLAQTIQAQQTAAAEARKATMTEELARLHDLDPDLAPDPKDFTKGSEQRGEITQYLVKQGIAPDSIADISAVEMVLAKKAKLWDDAQAALKAGPKPKPAATAQKAPVRPAAAAAAPNPSKQAAGKFHAQPSVENAIALLLAGKR